MLFVSKWTRAGVCRGTVCTKGFGLQLNPEPLYSALRSDMLRLPVFGVFLLIRLFEVGLSRQSELSYTCH